MANTTVARPYAKAAFEYALEQQALAQWAAMLRYAAMTVQDEQLKPLLNHPRVAQQQLAKLIIDICRRVLTREGENFMLILAAQHRLGALPEIYALYEQYRAEQEQVLSATVTSAFPLDVTAQTKLTKALAKRFQREVRLVCQINNALIGGAVIKIEELDFVIDGSVRGKLARMADALAT